jgi:hypothetical protein
VIARTNADLSPPEAMLCYKNLWMVEGAFRASKSLFATRPIFHKLDETIRGHVSCSLFALVLKKELEGCIANMGKPAADSEAAHDGSWPDILADLDSLTEAEVEQDGKRFLLRSAPRNAASLALRAAGVAPATHRAATPRRLIPTHHQRECSAKALLTWSATDGMLELYNNIARILREQYPTSPGRPRLEAPSRSTTKTTAPRQCRRSRFGNIQRSARRR